MCVRLLDTRPRVRLYVYVSRWPFSTQSLFFARSGTLHLSSHLSRKSPHPYRRLPPPRSATPMRALQCTRLACREAQPPRPRPGPGRRVHGCSGKGIAFDPCARERRTPRRARASRRMQTLPLPSSRDPNFGVGCVFAFKSIRSARGNVGPGKYGYVQCDAKGHRGRRSRGRRRRAMEEGMGWGEKIRWRWGEGMELLR
jgi:hypothetical protein